MVGQIAIFFITYLLLLIVAWLIGKVFLRTVAVNFSCRSFFASQFISLLLGLVLITCLTAIVIAKGNTIFILAFPLLWFIFLDGKTQIVKVANASNPTLPKLFLLVVFLILPFLYFVSIVCETDSVFITAPHFDALIYARLSEQLFETGFENRWVYMLHQQNPDTYTDPYHYFDLWLNALLSGITHLPAAHLLYLVSYPFFIFMSLIGLSAISEHFKIGTGAQIFLVPTVFLSGTIDLGFLAPWRNTLAFAELPVEMHGEKLGVMYPFILFAMLLYINNEKKKALLSIFFLCLVNTVTLPAFAMVSGFLVLNHLFTKREFPPKEITISALLIIGIVLFYFFNNGLPGQQHFIYKGVSLPHLNIKGQIIQLTSYITNTFLQFILQYFYVIPLLFLTWKLTDFNFFPFRFILLLFCVAIVAAGLLYNMFDYFQLYTNTLPIVHCMIALVLLKLFSIFKSNTFVRCTFIFLLLFVGFFKIEKCWSDYKSNIQAIKPSEQFLEFLAQTTFNEKETVPTGLMCSENDFEILAQSSDKHFLTFLSGFNLDPQPYLLTCRPSINFQKFKHLAPVFEKMQAFEPYCQFATSDSVLKHYAHDEVAITDAFIKKNKIRCLVLGPTFYPPNFIESKIQKQAIDPKTRVSVIWLKD